MEIEQFNGREFLVKINLKSAIKIQEKVCVMKTKILASKIKIIQSKSKLRSHKKIIYIVAELTKKELEIQKHEKLAM